RRRPPQPELSDRDAPVRAEIESFWLPPEHRSGAHLARTGAVRYAPSMPANRSSSPPRRYALRSLFGPGQDGMVSHTPHAAHLGIRVVEPGPGFGVCAVAYERTADDPFASALGTFMLGANRSDSSFERLVRAEKGGGE